MFITLLELLWREFHFLLLNKIVNYFNNLIPKHHNTL
jgi:hypothetical protein